MRFARMHWSQAKTGVADLLRFPRGTRVAASGGTGRASVKAQMADKKVQSPSSSERLDWALHPRRSEFEPGTRVRDPFEYASRPSSPNTTQPLSPKK